MRLYPSSQQLEYLSSLLPEDMVYPKKKVTKSTFTPSNGVPSVLENIKIKIKKHLTPSSLKEEKKKTSLR